MEKAVIIDEVIDDFTPKCFLLPFYGKKHKPVALGNAFKESKTKDKPYLEIYCPGYESESAKGLSIALTDPDAPSRDDPKWSEMCHWIILLPEVEERGWKFTVEVDTGAKELVACKSCAFKEFIGLLKFDVQTSRRDRLRRRDTTAMSSFFWRVITPT